VPASIRIEVTLTPEEGTYYLAYGGISNLIGELLDLFENYKLKPDPSQFIRFIDVV
jgi:hypothetical protein